MGRLVLSVGLVVLVSTCFGRIENAGESKSAETKIPLEILPPTRAHGTDDAVALLSNVTIRNIDDF
jgi:hypothetical protein